MFSTVLCLTVLIIFIRHMRDSMLICLYHGGPLQVKLLPVFFSFFVSSALFFLRPACTHTILTSAGARLSIVALSLLRCLS